MTDITDIQITGLADTETAPSDRGQLFNQYALILTPRPPADWANDFDQRWTQHYSMNKRRAWVVGGRLVVDCIESELQGLIDELKPIVAQTNAAHREAMKAQSEAAQHRAQAEADRKAGLATLKGSLKF